MSIIITLEGFESSNGRSIIRSFIRSIGYWGCEGWEINQRNQRRDEEIIKRARTYNMSRPAAVSYKPHPVHYLGRNNGGDSGPADSMNSMVLLLRRKHFQTCQFAVFPRRENAILRFSLDRVNPSSPIPRLIFTVQ
jgi:hypothetical protein